jgi:hypothetical protein
MLVFWASLIPEEMFLLNPGYSQLLEINFEDVINLKYIHIIFLMQMSKWMAHANTWHFYSE